MFRAKVAWFLDGVSSQSAGNQKVAQLELELELEPMDWKTHVQDVKAYDLLQSHANFIAQSCGPEVDHCHTTRIDQIDPYIYIDIYIYIVMSDESS